MAKSSIRVAGLAGLALAATAALSPALAQQTAQPAGAIVENSDCVGAQGRERSAPFLTGRYALIATNAAYKPSIGPLTETVRDGDIVCEALEALGFKVTHKRDLEFAAFQSAVAKHARNLTAAGDAAVGFFYYSGHGAALQTEGENFLIPVDAEIKTADELPLAALNLGAVVRTIAGADYARARANFIVIDACRNVAFQQGRRSGDRGLVPVRERGGALIAFSTSPGDTAVDANIFSTALANALQKPDRPAYEAFREVRREVLEKTKRDQFPWFRDGLIETFVFRDSGDAAAGSAASNQTPPVAPPNQPSSEPRVAGEPVLTIPACPFCPSMMVMDQGGQAESEARRMFAIALTETTFQEWENCVDAGDCREHRPDDEGWGREGRPVINVSHADAERYVAWLRKETGRPFRLPSNAEWSYAATWKEPPQGPVCDYANGAAHRLFGGLSCEDGRVIGTMPVKSRDPSDRGLYDMAGNVWEWVADCAGDDAETPGCARTLRGGSWQSGAGALAPESARTAPESYRSGTVGFRVALDWPPESW